MMWYRNSVALVCVAAGFAVAPGCVQHEDDFTVGSLDQAAHGVKKGKRLFNKETFHGNGTRCADCHPSGNGESGTLNPAEVEELFAIFQDDHDDDCDDWRHGHGHHDDDDDDDDRDLRKQAKALFQHDRADVIGGNTFNRFRAHATILVNLPLPPNVRIVGSDARSVILPRGIPTTMNTPALDPVLMYDGRDPNLQEQARGAILGHAQSTRVKNKELDAIAEFQETLFNRDNLEEFFEEGVPVTLPFGTTESEIRGRRFFIADGQTDPELVGESPQAICGWCHSGPFLNEMSAFAVTNIAPFPATEGHRFTPILVSALNAIGNPRYNFEFTNPDGSVTVVNSPDPGRALITGKPQDNGFFKTPTCWGVKDTAPYFHDNSAKTLEALMEHYDIALFILSDENPKNPPVIDLTEQQKADIIAYMMLL